MTQLKQMPMPQAIGLSSDTWQGTSNSLAIAAVASIIASGPQQTMRHSQADFSTDRPNQIGHQPVVAGRSVVGAQMHGHTGAAEIVDARRILHGADAVA